MKKYVEQEYPALGRVSICRKLPGANINSANYLIGAGGRKYVLKKDTIIPRKRLELEARVLAFCKRKGAKVPEVLPTAKGAFAGRGGFLLFVFSKGKFFSGNSKEMRSFARELARLHEALLRCPVPYPAQRMNARLYNMLSPRELKRMEKKFSRRKEWAAYFSALLEASTLLAKRKRVLARPQLIHGDLQPGNVFFAGNTVALILDFGGMHRGDALCELAFAAFRFSLFDAKKLSPHAIKERVMRFAKFYGAHDISFAQLRLGFLAEIFSRISYIMRQWQKTGKSVWACDFPKQANFLECVLRCS
ncbi:MAG: phosphotransferase [Parcubacteria group bacterium]|nr:phosphotransferase [Parcubacteria group bacterium]